MNDARVHRVAEGSANVHCAPLKSSGDGFTSVAVQVMSPVSLENLRNELRSDPVSALATQCTSTTTVTV